jgi:hypothetical protein
MTAIRLDLRKHCVETEIKRRYNRALSQYFKSGGRRQELEDQIEVLQRALETFDFNALRSTYPALAGRSEDSVRLTGTAGGAPVLWINDEAVPPHRR